VLHVVEYAMTAYQCKADDLDVGHGSAPVCPVSIRQSRPDREVIMSHPGWRYAADVGLPA